MNALYWAGRQASLTHSSLEMIMTWDWPTTYGWAMYFPEGYNPSEGMPEILSKAADDLHAKYPDIDISFRVVQGHPAPILVEASKVLTFWSSAVGDTVKFARHAHRLSQ